MGRPRCSRPSAAAGRNWCSSVAVVGIVALLGVSAGCGMGDDPGTATSVSGPIAILPLPERSLAECEDAFRTEATQDVPLAFPSPATVDAVEKVLGRFLVPGPVPEGLELMDRRLGGHQAYMRFEGAAEPGRRKRVLTIQQGPTDGRVWRIQAKDGYYESATVRGAPAYVIRGTFVVLSRMVKGERRLERCGWDPEEENSVVFLSEGHGVRISGSPASDFPPNELMAIAASLVETSESQETGSIERE